MWDFHMHSSYSEDSKEPMENMVAQAQALGIHEICFTEHYDTDFPHAPGKFQVDIEEYHKGLLEIRKMFPDMDIGFGIEAGFMPNTIEKTQDIVRQHDFDFILASVHIVDNVDLYYKGYTPEDREQAYLDYVSEILKILKKASYYSVVGHINYPSKMEVFKERPMFYSDFPDILDEIFRILIQNGKGMEMNTSSLRNCHSTDCVMDMLKRYKELGGEILTLGSDSHTTATLGFMYAEMLEVIKECGFDYIATFRGLKPVFHKI